MEPCTIIQLESASKARQLHPSCLLEMVLGPCRFPNPSVALAGMPSQVLAKQDLVAQQGVQRSGRRPGCGACLAICIPVRSERLTGPSLLLLLLI